MYWERRSRLTTVAAVLTSTNVLMAQYEELKLVAEDAAGGDRFGVCVSVSGELALVGAEFNDGSGSAYVFVRDQGGPDNWGQVAKLKADDAAGGDRFGVAVSMDVDFAVVGAEYHGGGAAYVFARGPWDQVAKLVAADAARNDHFGCSVSISGDLVVVGAYRNDDAGTDSGSAYVFARNEGGPDNWGQVVKLTASDGAPGDWFGFGVGVSGDVAVVGARHDDDMGADSGSAYVYARHHGGPDNWGQVAKLTALDGAAGDDFGRYVSVDDDHAVIQAWFDDDWGTDSGAAYVFARDQGGPDNWGQVRKLVAEDGDAGDVFGISVSISGDLVVVGAEHDAAPQWQSGSAYVFARDEGGPDNWGQAAKLSASDGDAGDHLGSSVSVDDGVIVVGALFDDAVGVDSGSAYVFVLPAEPPCAADITGVGGSDGNVDLLDYLLLIAQWGSPCVGACEADFTGPAGVPDGNVDSLDFLVLIAEWGTPGNCPTP